MYAPLKLHFQCETKLSLSLLFASVRQVYYWGINVTHFCNKVLVSMFSILVFIFFTMMVQLAYANLNSKSIPQYITVYYS